LSGPSASAPPREAAAGELVFGKYQIIRRLAVGGMGEVFLARQSGVAGFDRLVILKSLLPDLASQEDFVHQFLDEARVAATLNHPNIVSIYEVGLWNGTYFIAMEYIRGDNLARLQRVAERVKKRLPVDVAAYIVHDAAQALDHAHTATDLQGRALSIVHRDVSPQNIMVRTDGVTKVVDFGIAKAANRSSRTATGLLKGKVQYMAPEQVQGQDLDGRADQFALGVVLWEMVAGRKLFQGKNEIDILRAVIQAPIEPLTAVAPETPLALSQCVARMLERDREQRYSSLAEAAQDLKRFLEAGGMKSAQENTSELVRDLLGEEISAKTVDLTPSGANNFVINLSQSQPPSTSPTAAANAALLRRSSARLGVGAGALFALALAGGTAAFLLSPAPEPLAPEPLSLPAPPMGGAPEAAVPTPPPVSPPRYMLETQPPGATVKEGARVLGLTPLDTDALAPDEEHQLVIDLDGYKEERRSVKLRPGETFRDNKLTLKRKQSFERAPKGSERPPPTTAPTATAGTGLLTLDTKPWAKLYVDGKYVDTTPVNKVELAAGVHSIRLVNEGAGVDESRRITIKAGATFKESWQLKTAP
jgi:eukaryotic-like serine/threonine-protein kinase